MADYPEQGSEQDAREHPDTNLTPMTKATTDYLVNQTFVGTIGKQVKSYVDRNSTPTRDYGGDAYRQIVKGRNL